jgi:hypothetical protein
MALRAAGHCILVMPSGDNDAAEQGRLVVVQNTQPRAQILRGVVEHVGCHVDDGVEIGDVAHYTPNFLPLGQYHIVPVASLMAFEDDE